MIQSAHGGAESAASVPLVTVCIPTHNRKETLARTLEMLRAQTFQDFETIVCDDGSVDGTHQFLETVAYPRLTVLQNYPNLNYPETMRRLFEHARGRYIAVQHDHDMIEPNWLERMVALMAAHPGAGLGCCAFRFVGNDGRIIEEGSVGLSRAFPASGILPGAALIKILATEIHTPLAVTGSLFRRDIVGRAGGYRSEWYLASDEDLYRRVAALSDVVFCPERLLTLTARPPENSAKLGSWRAIFTLYEFRRHTTLSFLPGSAPGRRARALRLDTLKYVAVAKEATSLWMRGNGEGLADALRSDLIPCLPTGKSGLGAAGRLALAPIIRLMRRTPRLARLVARARDRVRMPPMEV